MNDGYSGVAEWLAPHDASAAEALTGWAGKPDRPVTGRSAPRPRELAADVVVPPGLLRRRAEGTLTCHAFLSPAAWERLSVNGPLSGPGPERVLEGDGSDAMFVAAYDWMRWQMRRRLPGYGGGYPLWVWVRTTRLALVDQAKRNVAIENSAVLVTVQVSPDRLLMSDFDDWHAVLNSRPCPPVVCPGCGAGRCGDPMCLERWFDDWDDSWSDRIEKATGGLSSPWWTWPSSLQREVFETWDTIFDDLDHRRRVQGCLDHIDAEWITHATRAH